MIWSIGPHDELLDHRHRRALHCRDVQRSRTVVVLFRSRHGRDEWQDAFVTGLALERALSAPIRSLPFLEASFLLPPKSPICTDVSRRALRRRTVLAD